MHFPLIGKAFSFRESFMLEMSYYGNFSKSEFESLPLILQRFLS